ncbi:MAG: hypothetical protein ACKPCM_02690, partial [Pseudanabaena sp.]
LTHWVDVVRAKPAPHLPQAQSTRSICVSPMINIFPPTSMGIPSGSNYFNISQPAIAGVENITVFILP